MDQNAAVGAVGRDKEAVAIRGHRNIVADTIEPGAAADMVARTLGRRGVAPAAVAFDRWHDDRRAGNDCFEKCRGRRGLEATGNRMGTHGRRRNRLRRETAPGLHHHERQLRQAETEAAVIGRGEQAEPAFGGHAGVHLAVEAAALAAQARACGSAAGLRQQLGDAVLQQALLVGEDQFHGILRWCQTLRV